MDQRSAVRLGQCKTVEAHHPDQAIKAMAGAVIDIYDWIDNNFRDLQLYGQELRSAKSRIRDLEREVEDLKRTVTILRMNR